MESQALELNVLKVLSLIDLVLVLIALFTGVTYILQQFWLSNYHSHLEQIVGFNICLFVDIGFVYENKGRFRSMVVVLDVSDTYASILLDIVS